MKLCGCSSVLVMKQLITHGCSMCSLDSTLYGKQNVENNQYNLVCLTMLVRTNPLGYAASKLKQNPQYFMYYCHPYDLCLYEQNMPQQHSRPATAISDNTNIDLQWQHIFHKHRQTKNYNNNTTLQCSVRLSPVQQYYHTKQFQKNTKNNHNKKVSSH